MQQIHIARNASVAGALIAIVALGAIRQASAGIEVQALGRVEGLEQFPIRIYGTSFNGQFAVGETDGSFGDEQFAVAWTEESAAVNVIASGSSSIASDVTDTGLIFGSQTRHDLDGNRARIWGVLDEDPYPLPILFSSTERGSPRHVSADGSRLAGLVKGGLEGTISATWEGLQVRLDTLSLELSLKLLAVM